MRTIETQRLRLYPLENHELRQLIDEETSAELKQAYQEMLDGCINDPERRIWHTIWLMELKETPGTIVGDFCFKGVSTDGMVEIGYGLREGFCKKGYMTEVVQVVSQWALKQEGITRVEAETELENIASKKVLLNAGFTENGRFGEEGPRYTFLGKECR